MKRKYYLALLIGLAAAFAADAQTWDEWFRQRRTQRKYLLQQIAKLQVHLSYVKKGYDIVHAGMNLISDLKKGDLTLHTLFFDHLKQVSPIVRRYEKAAGILRLYVTMVDAYKTNYKKFTQSSGLSASEVEFIYKLFTGILHKAADDIVQLTDVLTDYSLQMSDADRMKRIDGLHQLMLEKHTSVIALINKSEVLLLQRQRELKDVEMLQKNYAP